MPGFSGVAAFNGQVAGQQQNQLYPRAWKVVVANDENVPEFALDVSKLDLEFEVLRNIKPVPNRCALTIWNLNADNRASILRRNQPNPKSRQLLGVPVRIDAGLGSQMSTIFYGDLREVASVRTFTDWKTSLHGDDGGRVYREARINQSFSQGTLLSTVIQQCANAMRVGLGNVQTQTQSASIAAWGQTLPHNLTLSGQASKMLDRALKSCGLTWSIQSGSLQVLPIGGSLNRPAIVVSSSTGLLDSPEASIDSTVSLGNPQQFSASAPVKTPNAPKPKDPSILKVTTLMIPGIVPGQIIDLRSNAFNGSYVLTECRYVGKTWSPNDWRIESICRVSN